MSRSQMILYSKITTSLGIFILMFIYDIIKIGDEYDKFQKRLANFAKK